MRHPRSRRRAPTGQWITDLWQDLRYAARMFRKQPGFTAAAVLTLALGIGATTAIFSVVYGVLLKPLPFHEPERLVSLIHRCRAECRNHGPATYFTYLDNQRAFEAIGAWESNDVTITGRGEPEHAFVLSVSDTTLPLLRVQPVLGRLFTAADDGPGSPLRAVLTYGYWQRRFGGADGVIGQSLDDRRRARPKSSACCRRRSSSCARRRHCCCRCSWIAPTRTTSSSTSRSWHG